LPSADHFGNEGAKSHPVQPPFAEIELQVLRID
jgi:hypothetical protein